jgi:hypothetical protein
LFADVMMWWDDGEGRATLGSGLVEGKPMVVVPGVGNFVLQDGDRVVTRCEPGAEEALIDAYRRFAAPLLLQWSGAEALHAGAVLGARGVVGISGPSGAGKSTLVTSLTGAGGVAWADDVLVWSPAPSPRARSLPFRLRPRRGAGRADLPAPVEPTEQLGEREIAAVVHLAPNAPVDAPGLESLRPADAFDELVTGALCLTLQDRTRTRDMVDHYFDLAHNVTSYRLHFRRNGDDLPAVLAILLPLLR